MWILMVILKYVIHGGKEWNALDLHGNILVAGAYRAVSVEDA